MDRPLAHHMLLCLSSLSASSTPLLMMYRPCTCLVKYWSPNIHNRRTPDGGFYWVQFKNASTHEACVCAFDKGWECDSEKTNDMKTRSGRMDSAAVLNPYMFWIMAKPQRPKRRCSSFLSPEQILGLVTWFLTSRCPDVKNLKEI